MRGGDLPFEYIKYIYTSVYEGILKKKPTQLEVISAVLKLKSQTEVHPAVARMLRKIYGKETLETDIIST